MTEPCRDTAGCEMLRVLARLFDCPAPPPDYHFVTIALGTPRPRTNRQPANQETDMAVQKLEQNQEIEARLTGIVDSQGRPAAFDGAPVWASSDETVIDLRVAPDGLSALVGSLAKDGTATVTVTGDARQGPDVVAKVGVISLVVGPGDVDVFEIQLATPRPRTA